MALAFCIAAFSVGIILSFALFVPALRTLYLHVFAALRCIPSRGLGTFNMNNGAGLLFKAQKPLNKIMCRYLLYTEDDSTQKYFMGEWADGVVHAVYDIMAYNPRGFLIGVYRIAEFSGGSKFTARYSLPGNTEKIAVSARSLNGKRVQGTNFVSVKYVLWALLTALVCSAFAFTTAAMIYLVVFISAGGLQAADLIGWRGLAAWSCCTAFFISSVISAWPFILSGIIRLAGIIKNSLADLCRLSIFRRGERGKRHE